MRAVVRGIEWGRPSPRAARRRRPAGGSERPTTSIPISIRFPITTRLAPSRSIPGASGWPRAKSRVRLGDSRVWRAKKWWTGGELNSRHRDFQSRGLSGRTACQDLRLVRGRGSGLPLRCRPGGRPCGGSGSGAIHPRPLTASRQPAGRRPRASSGSRPRRARSPRAPRPTSSTRARRSRPRPRRSPHTQQRGPATPPGACPRS
jgi:hypothetical protein